MTFRVSQDVVARKLKVYVLVYHSREGFRLGNDHLGKKHVCCTAAMLRDRKCDQEGEIFMRGQIQGTSNRFFLFPIFLNRTEVTFQEDIKVFETGVYYYFLANCKDAPVTVTGTMMFLNPFGFLGVTEFPSLVFYSMATWIYVFAVMGEGEKKKVGGGWGGAFFCFFFFFF